MKRGGYLKRRTPLKARGNSAFPARRHPEFMRWMRAKCKEGPRPCDGCRRWRWLERAHLKSRVSGGNDLGGVCLLCRTCHEAQEKRTDAWIAETGVDLWARAREYEREFLTRPTREAQSLRSGEP